MTDMRDELLERIVDELQTLPPVDEGAVAGIVSTVVADTGATGSGRVPAASPRAGAAKGTSWWRAHVPLAAAAGFALAAGLGGFVVGDAARRSPTPTVVAVSESAPESLALASATLPPAQGTPARRPLPATVPTQFVLEAPRASRVALVGDFNAWDAGATALTRVSTSGIWTATVALAPGRHTYAFMVDDTTWTLDPRAPTAHDPDFGTPSSVVLVGTP